MTTIYPHVFKFSDHTTDPRLLKYDSVLQGLYQSVLQYASQSQNPINNELFEQAKVPEVASSKLQEIVSIINRDQTRVKSFIPDSFTDEEKGHIVSLFIKQYQPGGTITVWPPEGYPDVPHTEEGTVALPPICMVPGRKTESILYSVLRPLRGILDDTINPAFKNKTLKEAFTLLKTLPLPGNLIGADTSIQGVYAVRTALGDMSANISSKFIEWTRIGQTINDTILVEANPDVTRFYGSITKNADWISYLTKQVYNTSYTEFDYSLQGTIPPGSNRLLRNRNQQVFVVVPVDTNITEDTPTTLAGAAFIPLNNYAWIKFNYPFPKPSMPDRDVFMGLVHFQGYRLMDMPPAPILKAFAHGPPVDMAPHVRELFPEWTSADTCAAWLDSVMAKWLSDILALKEKLQTNLCVDGRPNDKWWHLRDSATVQMDLYIDVVNYINKLPGTRSTFEILSKQANTMDPNLLYTKVKQFGDTYKSVLPMSKLQQIIPRTSQTKDVYRAQLKEQLADLLKSLKGGRRKTAVKSKRMARHGKQTRKQHKASRSTQQRGGAATGMPLAYFQDGAQMRGTYAEPTGVGLAGSTNTMARVGISQTGGEHVPCDGRYAQRSGRRQGGGFIPSIMGPVVQNGAYLMPVASYMGYKMLRGKRPAVGLLGSFKSRHKGSRSASRYASRGPRATQKKRRSSRRN